MLREWLYLTFICGPWDAFHDCAPVHHIVVCGTQFEKRIVGVVLVCLELRHEPLYRRVVAR